MGFGFILASVYFVQCVWAENSNKIIKYPVTLTSVIQVWNFLQYILMKRILYFVYIFDNASGVITIIFTVMDVKRNWIYKLWRESVIWNFLEIGVAGTESYYTRIDRWKSFRIAYIISCEVTSIAW